MANYDAKFRTSFATMKDRKAFLAWVATIPGLEPLTRPDPRTERYFAMVCDGGTPDCDADDTPIDFYADLAAHLEDGQTIILMETGSEGYRYLVGQAIAVHSNGKTATVTLNDIYDRAREAFGSTFSRAEY